MEQPQVSIYVSRGFQARYNEDPKRQMAANRKAREKREWRKMQSMRDAVKDGSVTDSAKLARLGRSVKKVLEYMDISIEEFSRAFVENATVDYCFRQPPSEDGVGEESSEETGVGRV